MFKVTTGRAISDYWAAQSRRQATDDSEGGERVSLPGLIGATKYQRTWELNRRLAHLLIDKCDDALADTSLSDGNRASIAQSRTAVAEALAAYEDSNDD